MSALNLALDEVMAAVGPDASGPVVRRIRTGLAKHAEALERAREATDPIAMPRRSFDPADPKIVGRMVSLALLAQPMVPLRDIRPAYGSGVYAIYYCGGHSLYSRISGTETPIYVGKADPAHGDASNAREQGDRLTGRLIEHANTIETVAKFALTNGLPQGLEAIKSEEFLCRRLVCATNAQLVAERHLIRMFWPIWNSDTKACWGMSKHGDSSKTRKNKRSPWDVVHPGRLWAIDDELEDKLSPTEIREAIDKVLRDYPPRVDHAALLEEMLASFRQVGGAVEVEGPPPLPEVSGPGPDEAGEEGED